MGTRQSLLCAALLALAPDLLAQDPVASLPEAYSLQFENAWVKVVRVHYAAGASLPRHSHPAATLAFVYLTDAGPVDFNHTGSGGTVTRPEVRAGTYRLARGRDETHAVENRSDTTSDFLRVELKTDAARVSPFRRRVARKAYAVADTVADVEFTNAQVRISRLRIAAGAALEVTTASGEPALVIAVTDARLSLARAGSEDMALANGQQRWIDPGQRERMSNAGTAPIELLRFDFLTGPKK